MEPVRRILGGGLTTVSQTAVIVACISGIAAAVFFHVTTFTGLGIDQFPLPLLTLAFLLPSAVAWYATGIMKRAPFAGLVILAIAGVLSLACGMVAAFTYPGVVFALAGPLLIAAAVTWALGLLVMPRLDTRSVAQPL